MTKGNRLRAARRADKRCIFCGDLVGSQEHLWSDWLKHSTVVDHTSVNHDQVQITNTFASSDVGQIAIITPDWTRHSGSPTKHKKPEVCAKCNNGWMSRLENQTKPALLAMVDGESRTLGALEQRTVARWADKTAIVHETTSVKTLISRPEDRVRIMQEDDPTPAQHTRVWIGRADTPTVSPSSRARSVRAVELETGEVGGMRSVVLAVGYVVLYVVGATFTDFAADVPSAVEALGNKLMRIWPIAQQNAAWPPVELLSSSDIDVLADSIHEDY